VLDSGQASAIPGPVQRSRKKCAQTPKAAPKAIGLARPTANQPNAISAIGVTRLCV
jgi:hypothetical protein